MEAVVRDFDDRKRDEDPVIYFYELFLKEYDAKKRIQRGVFYTPQPVVSYIVRSVHELLQTEFGLEDGLASTATWSDMAAKHPGLKIPDEVKPSEPFVVILDPATGTATFLVEVIDVIYLTLTAKWKQQRLTDGQQRAAWNEYVP
jgi:type I restriction-modification system DNA methylase subunit